jgi:uncharacterized paraquat-inducible protein A
MMRLCANPTCMIGFEPSRHNQKYCSKECCKVVTNSKIMQQYYENKDRKAGKPRTCDVCEVAKLSRYNESNTCASCVAREEAASRNNLLRALGAV